MASYAFRTNKDDLEIDTKLHEEKNKGKGAVNRYIIEALTYYMNHEKLENSKIDSIADDINKILTRLNNIKVISECTADTNTTSGEDLKEAEILSGGILDLLNI